MKVGDCFRMKRATTYFDDGRSSIEWRPAGKGRVFVAVYIGTEPAEVVDGNGRVDVLTVMRELGWVPAPIASTVHVIGSSKRRRR